jgi:hypothetical protein
MIEYRLRWLVLILTLLVMIVAMLTVLFDRWMQRRCARLGHRWQQTPDGVRCGRCKHAMNEGDYM